MAALENVEALVKVEPPVEDIQFHHIQIYTDKLKALEEYKKMEDGLSKCSPQLLDSELSPWDDGIKKILEINGLEQLDAEKYVPHGQDLVEQMIFGFGFRITHEHEVSGLRSFLLCSRDATGVKYLISGLVDEPDQPNVKRQKTNENKEYCHLNLDSYNRFLKAHNNRQGISVLGFQVEKDGTSKILERYKEKHPKLLLGGVHEYSGCRLLEVFAYYKGTEKEEADEGTIIRFVENSESQGTNFLPGLNPVKHKFSEDPMSPAYFDHWVSNVTSRTMFLETLYDTLGFTSKVDFNAGVVAAGEAQIESTVTGNTSKFRPESDNENLANQSQVFLPINNALSPVGHVYLFLQEIGQGIQHVASRVEDLSEFVSNVNKMREMTGRGVSFLKIPRSYYGRLALEDLIEVKDGSPYGVQGPISQPLGKAVMQALQDTKKMSPSGIVKLGITQQDIEHLGPMIPPTLQSEFGERMKVIGDVVRKSQYINLYKLLRDHVSEENYLKIVKNNVLVDIQGEDVLYQIFTSTILQRSQGDEAPFLEFIQRVCSQQLDANGNPKKILPGCGGFGIRNFLTLFLSIEVGKASAEYEEAIKTDNTGLKELALEKIALFAQQMDESNPVLTEISDAMTAEGQARDIYERAKDKVEKDKAEADFKRHRAQKELGNEKLQKISEIYKEKALNLRKRTTELLSH
eukprot:m.332593 g.332593  ORF g.332593 m.332593 type:complete len:688 (+) comp16964_c0_seq1:54-2117(+)